MKCSLRLLSALLVAALLLSVVQPVLAQEEMERTGLRPDAPTYAVRGPHWVGYQPLVIGEGTEDEMEVDVWYPALNPEGAKEDVAYEFTLNTPDWASDGPAFTQGHAILDAPVDESAEPYPLVVFSHGFSCNPEWYPTIGEHLASYGFVVLAPEHVEAFDWDFSESLPATIDRPADIKHTLDFAEELTAADGDLAGQIDMENVAVIGHSMGGYTTLAIAGAQFDYEAYTERCESVAETDPDTYQSMCALMVGQEEYLAERAGFEQVPEGLWPSMGDPRVTAIIPLAGDSYLFDKAGLAKITIPMMAIGATADTLTPYEWGSKPSYDYASSDKKALVTFEGGEHTFPMGQAESIAWVSRTPFYGYADMDPIWDRARTLDLTHHFATAFLLDTLKGDAEAAAALAPEAVSFPGISYQAEGYGPAPEVAEAEPLQVRHALAAVNDIIMYYETVGEGEPVLLLPGGTMCTDAWEWTGIYGTLASHFKIIAPDSRAQGRSTDSDQPLTYQLMADDMVALLDHMGIDSAHVVGWSDGAITGLDMAMRYPERVRSIVATGPQNGVDGLTEEAYEEQVNMSVDTMDADWADFCYRSIASDPEHLPVVIEKIRNMYMQPEFFDAESLAGIAIPVLFLEGANSDLVRVEHIEELAAEVPYAQMQRIEDTGHFAPMEKSDEWSMAVLQFLMDATE